MTPAQHRASAAELKDLAINAITLTDLSHSREQLMQMLGCVSLPFVAAADTVNLALAPIDATIKGLQSVAHSSAARKGEQKIERLQAQLVDLAAGLQGPGDVAREKAILKTLEALVRLEPQANKASLAQIAGDYRQVGSTDPENSVPKFIPDRSTLKQSIGADGAEVSFTNGELTQAPPNTPFQAGPAAFGIVRQWSETNEPGKFNVAIKNFLAGPPVSAAISAKTAASGPYAPLPAPPITAPIELLYSSTKGDSKILAYRAPSAQNPGTMNLFVLKSLETKAA